MALQPDFLQRSRRRQAVASALEAGVDLYHALDTVTIFEHSFPDPHLLWQGFSSSIVYLQKEIEMRVSLSVVYCNKKSSRPRYPLSQIFTFSRLESL